VGSAALALAILDPARAVAAERGLPRPDRVVVVVEENRPLREILGSPEAPYINALARRGARFTASFGITYPSQPNYLALFAGSTFGVRSNHCPLRLRGPNLASALLDAGLGFAGYSESLPAIGFTGCSAGNYARKHNPWVNFPALPPGVNRPFASFPRDYAELPTVSFVVPDEQHDMHDGSVAEGDAWLRSHLGPYVRWADAHNSLLILTWDEDDHSSGNRIPTIFVGPMVRSGRYCERITHFTVLRTLLGMYDLAPLRRSRNAEPVTSPWTPQSAPSPVILAWVAPRDGERFDRGTDVELRVDASSAVPLRRVEFFRGREKLGEANASPFIFTWRRVPPGTHCLLAKAADTAGNVKTSPSVVVRVRRAG
jgi:acid phosphatase